MPLSAARLLQPDSPIKPAWAVFDPVWYLRAYGAWLPAGIAYTPAALLDHYLRHGAAARHSPSAVFDERYYLAANPDAAAAVQAGRFASGFDHFCQIGHRRLNGHWLFDDAFYGDFYEDLALGNLDANGICGRYDHYLRAGQHEQRIAHPLFDGRFYTARAIAAGQDRLLAQHGPYMHFLLHLQSDAGELPPSCYFDPQWYASRYPQCRSAGAAAIPGSAIRHYLCATAEDAFDPLPEFSERFYRESNQDVRGALADGAIPSGYRHFLQTGVFELRQPHPDIDLAFYCSANASVRNDLNTGASRDAFAHLREIGLRDGLRHTPPGQEPAIGERAARDVLRQRAEADLAGFAHGRLDFTPRGACCLAVILTLSGDFAVSLRALSALRGAFAGDMELFIVDHGLSDGNAEIGCHVMGARIIRPARPVDHAQARNMALAESSAGFVLFLDGQAEPGFLAIAAALSRIRSAPDIAAVGGKLVRSHGLLRQAGGIVWRDGSISGYMYDAPPSAPEANFLREVDFCSGVFLLCRAAFVKALGGFDMEFSPGRYDDADLCLRMAAAGGRILYDPAVVVHHSALDRVSDAEQALLRRGQRIFRRKHEPLLATKPDHAMRNLAAARTPRRGQKNILFIEDRVPLRRFGSGHVRANDVIHAMAAAGHAVSVFPLAAAPASLLQIRSGFPDGVEVLHDRDISGLAAFMEERRGFYDLIWICRTHNLGRVLPEFLQAGIDPRDTPFVLDTEALGTLREAGRARLRGAGDFNFPARLREELEDTALCRVCVAVNAEEAGLLRGLDLPACVLGTMREPDITANGFDARAGILFVGALHEEDSPNFDALRWYAEAILPALEREMDPVPMLHVAGYHAPDVDLRGLAEHPRIRLHGAAESLRDLYEKSRIFIAPTRFAAGTPYKLYEAASYGVPIVATDLLVRQLGWRTGEEILAAPGDDARRFAGEIARLYRDRLLWSRLRHDAAARIERENAPAEFRAAVGGIIGHALESGAVIAPGDGHAGGDERGSGAGSERAAGNAVAV